MSGSEALIDHHNRRTADGVLTAHRDPPIETRRGKDHCGACGRAWFGDVDYCPYCGLPNASSPSKPAAASSPALERAEAAREHVSEIDRRPAQAWDDLSVPVLLVIDSAADERSLPPKPSQNATALVAAVVVLGAIAVAALRFLDGQIEAPSGGRSAAVAGPVGDKPSSEDPALSLLDKQIEAQPGGTSAAVAGPVGDMPSSENPQHFAPPTAQELVPAPEAAASSPVVSEMREQSVSEGDPSMNAEPMATADGMPNSERQASMQTQPSVPLPRHRNLCSPASEAAGLCSPN